MELKDIFDKAERIGVIGSPSSTGELSLDILGTAVNKRLVGNLSLFHYLQDGQDHYVLGQITEIVMQNVWTQDPTMRGLIRQKGRVDPITERQDTHTAKMMISSVFTDTDNGIEPSILGTVPSTGTSIKLLNEDIMESILWDYKKELFYLGEAYGTVLKLPMWLKHFGKGDYGAGEAYHIGIFGKSGSGKSVVAKMMMMAYARHKEMSIFVLDPQGEFSQDMKDTNAPIKEKIEEDLSRGVEVYDLHKLVLTGDDLLKRVIVNSGFLDDIGVFHENNKMQAAEQIVKILKIKFKQSNLTVSNDTFPPYKAYLRDAFDKVWHHLKEEDFLKHIYTSPDLRVRVKSAIENSDPDSKYEFWRGIMNLFKFIRGSDNAKIKDLVKKIHEDSNIVIINLSESDLPPNVFLNDSLKHIIIGEFLNRINKEAESIYKENRLLNSLIIIDEAHRLASRERSDNEEMERVKNILIDAVRTTRKYGLGWMFISQSLSSLQREIINQMRIYLFGFGLAWGIERKALLEIIGGQSESISLYQLFKDPQSSLGKKEYPFMSIGPISPFSFSGTPLFFNALEFPEEFLENNDW